MPSLRSSAVKKEYPVCHYLINPLKTPDQKKSVIIRLIRVIRVPLKQNPLQSAKPVSSVFHCSSQGANSFRRGAKVFRVGANSFRQGANSFRQGANSFRQGANSFRQGANSFRQGANSFRRGAKVFRVGANPFRQGAKAFRVGANPFRQGANDFREGAHRECKTNCVIKIFSTFVCRGV